MIPVLRTEGLCWGILNVVAEITNFRQNWWLFIFPMRGFAGAWIVPDLTRPEKIPWSAIHFLSTKQMQKLHLPFRLLYGNTLNFVHPGDAFGPALNLQQ
jgi:hypothetical protein